MHLELPGDFFDLFLLVSILKYGLLGVLLVQKKDGQVVLILDFDLLSDEELDKRAEHASSP